MNKHNQKYISLEQIYIFLFTIYIFICFVFVSIFDSLVMELISLSTLLFIILIIYLLDNRKLYLTRLDILWIVPVLVLIFEMRSIDRTVGAMAGSISFLIGIVLIIFGKVNTKHYYLAINIIKYASIFYAISVFVSILFPVIYEEHFVSLFQPWNQKAIMQNLNEGYITGFTNQVAFTAGYIIFGIGIITCNFIVKKQLKKHIFTLLFLLIALLFTQKRGPLIFILIAIFITYIIYTADGQKTKKILKTIFGSGLLLGLGIGLMYTLNIGEKLFARTLQTFIDYANGLDITNGRSALYRHAITLFKKNPIWGIGWGNFRTNIVGVVTVETRMHTHNIYLQLLCETGIIGTISILTPMLITYFSTANYIKKVTNKKIIATPHTIYLIVYSFFIQTYILAYGMTGNVLYDSCFLFMYFFACGMFYSAKKTMDLH